MNNREVLGVSVAVIIFVLILILGVTAIVFTLIWNKRSENQTHRAVAAVIGAVSVPAVGLLSLLVGAPEELSATWFWTLGSCAQIVVCTFLAYLHISQMKRDVQTYRLHFKNQLSEPSVPEESSAKDNVSIEGQSSFTVLLWGIYGIAALLGSVVLYFVVAQFWKEHQEVGTFIFKNNEGFIAALTLLIIVVSGAAVPIYTALAEQVRGQIDTFELQVSDLHRATVNVTDHANPLWSHFLSVSQAAILNWQFTEEQVARGAHDLLFKPFFTLGDGQSLYEVTDDELRRRSVADVPITYNAAPVFPDEILRGFRDSYLATPCLVASKERILSNQLFLPSNSEDDDNSHLVRERGDELPFSDRLQRARRLRYLGWMAQGALARAVTDERSALTKIQPIPGRIKSFELVRYRYHQPRNLAEATVRHLLVPPSEDFMLAVLKQSLVFKPNAKDGEDHRNEPQKLAAEYRDRAERHTEKWRTTLSSTLVGACNALDLDIGPLVDDVILLDHLAVTKSEYEEGSLARFVYYGHWLNAITDRDSRIFTLLSVLREAPVFDQAKRHQQVSDANDIRRTLILLSRQVGTFVDSDEIHQDPILDEVFHQMPQGWMLEVLASYLNFSKSWLVEVQRIEQRLELGELNSKQRTFLKWIVGVLGVPGEREDHRHQEVKDEELWSRALGLVNLQVRPSGNDEDEFAARFHEILDRVYVRCVSEDHNTELMDTFFGREEQVSRQEEAYARLTTWRVKLNEKEQLRKKEQSERFKTDRSSLNLTKEFLLLMLADHKSALFNWMRAARAVEVRERVAKFNAELNLLHKHQRVKKQLGIEIIPSRHDRLEHLRDYLGFVGYQKPLQVRSIYDLQPTPVDREMQNTRAEQMRRLKWHQERELVMEPYNRLRSTLNISKQWRGAVAIDEATQHWVYQRFFEASDGPMPEANRSDTLIRFLLWIVRVLDPDQDLVALENVNPEDLMLLALRHVNPRIQRRHEQEQQPENQLQELTEEQYEIQLADINQRVLAYCLDKENSQDLQATFFALKHRPRAARQKYKEWYNGVVNQSASPAQ